MDMILNVVDHYMKQIHLFPVTSQITVDGVASIYFDHVFPLHRIPQKIISDRGPQFAARSMRALYKRLGICQEAALTRRTSWRRSGRKSWAWPVW